MDRRKNPCDEARDYWENREGRWVRVHNIALTLFDPMHDEQPFCQHLIERRRTTVKFLGQQCEITIDDTWPQAGEMRSLWKGTIEFWTSDMPQDDTRKPNRHHSNILPLFRNHVTRDTAAMFPLFQNPLASTEHECRDHPLPAVLHTEDAEEEGRSVVLGLHSNHHDSSNGTESQRQGRNHGSQQVHTAGVDVRRAEAKFQQEYGGTICPEQSDRNSIPTGTGDGKDVADHESIGGYSQPVNEDRQEKTLAGHQKDKDPVGEWYETVKEEEKLQSNRDVTVQCTDFCEVTTSDVHAVLRHAPADLRGGTLLQHTRVLVATVAHQENPHLCLQILHAAKFHVFRGAYILLRVLADTKSQEAQGLLDEIRRQSSVSVLSGPAIVITSVATASVFSAKGWSTESVSRVVRTGRTAREIHEKERADHAYYSHIHDEVTVYDAFPATIQNLDEDESLPEDTAQDDQEKHCRHGDRFRRIMKIWDMHQIARWYECCVSVEPSADSSWQPPGAGVVLVKHRNVQPVQS